ncbi:hypothetical protein Rs2_04755 [Raphanus sativus]|nr:hypothetical protein Rs2_04755 [Raphanus sativus]
MAVNCFSGESPDEIYSGAFLQPIRVRCAFVPLWKCLLTSSSNLPAPVKLSVAIACFFCSRSFQCTDLKFHRLLPSSSALCPMNSVPKGMTSAASDSCSSNLAHKDECSFSQSLLDFTDQRLDVGSVKSPWLQHGNAGVRIFCLNSSLRFIERSEHTEPATDGPPGICASTLSLIQDDEMLFFLVAVTFWPRHGNVGRWSQCVTSTTGCSSSLVRFLSQVPNYSSCCAHKPTFRICSLFSCSELSKSIEEPENLFPAMKSRRYIPISLNDSDNICCSVAPICGNFGNEKRHDLCSQL